MLVGRLAAGPLIGSACPTIGIPHMPLSTYNNNKYTIITNLPFMFIISSTTHDEVKRKYMLMLMHHDYPLILFPPQEINHMFLSFISMLSFLWKVGK